MTSMDLPEVGIGIVYVPGLEPLLEPGNTCVGVIEIEPETLWSYREQGPRPYSLPAETVDHLLSFPQRKTVHSVGFAVGGTQLPPPAYCDALADVTRVLGAPWASGHLSFTHFRRRDAVVHTGFMLPSLQTVEGALAAAETIRHVAAQLPVSFAVETTVNYLAPRDGELTDGQFVALAAEEADCGILLDLHNIWTNERNGRQSVADFLSDIPLDRVWEIHLGGGFEYDGYWLDAHSGPVPPPVLDLARDLIATLPNLKSIVYEIYPAFVELFGLDNIQRQLEDMDAIWARRSKAEIAGSTDRRGQPSISELPAAGEGVQRSPDRWEQELGGLVTHACSGDCQNSALAADKSIGLIKTLSWKFRASSIVKSLDVLTQLLLIDVGEVELERLLDDYFAATTPRAFASEESRHFISFLQSQALRTPYIGDVMRYEETRLRAAIDREPKYTNFDYDPRNLVEALASGHIPEDLEAGNFELEILP